MYKNYTLYFAWLLSCLGTLISLYFSEILGLEPCHLCWYQRICLFPLTLTLGIATYKTFPPIATYVLPQVFIGLCFAGYQVALQEIPGWNPIEICGKGPSCSDKLSIGLGPLSIPMLSAACFLVIFVLLLFSLKKERH